MGDGWRWDGYQHLPREWLKCSSYTIHSDWVLPHKSPNLAVFGCIWAYAFDGRLIDGFLPVLTDGYLEFTTRTASSAKLAVNFLCALAISCWIDIPISIAVF